MPATLDAKTKRILIELAADKSLTAAQRLEAIKYLIDIKARKPNTKTKPKKPMGSLLG